MLIVSPVQHLEVPKGHVADSHIEEAVGHLHLFKAVHSDAAVLVKLSGDTARYAVNLHAVGFAVRHAVRDHADEISHATGRL